ncbi:MAG: DUF1573 domain-containing protein [Ignavibacteria bacterium]|nr:DUF1573 domain-containing protein [Ignavibacteria bacterium]MBI3765803.1 DUF1573 domain-containing protein [Ignavibacteriales bacterium]
MINKIFVTAVVIVCTVGSMFSQPKIKAIPEGALDLGDYYQGQKAEKVMLIKNVGKDTLRISDVKAQCGCTATMMTEKTLAPNAEGKLSITFDTHNYNGKVAKQVYVSSNDTSTPKLTIQFTANVMQVLNLTPAFFSFDNAKVDSTYTKTITIANPSQKQGIKILSVDTKFDQIKISLMKNQLMPGEQTQLQAVFHPVKSGTYQGVVELTTDNPLQPKYEVKFYSWVNRK